MDGTVIAVFTLSVGKMSGWIDSEAESPAVHAIAVGYPSIEIQQQEQRKLGGQVARDDTQNNQADTRATQHDSARAYLRHGGVVLRPSRLVDDGQVHHGPGRRRLFGQVAALKQHLRRRLRARQTGGTLTHEVCTTSRQEIATTKIALPVG